MPSIQLQESHLTLISTLNRSFSDFHWVYSLIFGLVNPLFPNRSTFCRARMYKNEQIWGRIHLTFPSAYGRSIFTTPWLEIGGTVILYYFVNLLSPNSLFCATGPRKMCKDWFLSGNWIPHEVSLWWRVAVSIRWMEESIGLAKRSRL